MAIMLFATYCFLICLPRISNPSNDLTNKSNAHATVYSTFTSSQTTDRRLEVLILILLIIKFRKQKNNYQKQAFFQLPITLPPIKTGGKDR